MSLTITDIQRFCVHDGPGIRTTVFLKGCTLRCPWCANPETINPNIEYAIDNKRCIHPQNECKINRDCNLTLKKPLTKDDYEHCKKKAIIQIGKIVSEEYILEQIEKDRIYYDEGGGITFSGGEPLLQLQSNIDFLKIIHKSFNICVETALCIKLKNMKILQENIDLFFIDLKSLIDSDYKQLTGGELNKVLYNMDQLKQYGRCKDIIIRIPFIPGYSNKIENIKKLNDLLREYNVHEIQILKLHNLAKDKYNLLGVPFKYNAVIEDNVLYDFKSKIYHDNVIVLKI